MIPSQFAYEDIAHDLQRSVTSGFRLFSRIRFSGGKDSVGMHNMKVKCFLSVCVIALGSLTGCCASRSPTPSTESGCVGELSQEELLDIVKEAVRVSGGDPSAFTQEYGVSTSREGCDYLVSAVSNTTTNHFSLLIDRSGRIKSWPWCCEPSFFVPPLKRSN